MNPHPEHQHTYAQVPPDYWDRSYGKNIIQTAYHGSRFYILRKCMWTIPNGGRLLDIGSGAGFTIERVVSERSDIQVDCVDVSAELVGYGTKHRPLFRFRQASGEELPYDAGNFDAVTYLDVIEHLVDPARSLYEAHRVLKTGGRVIVQVAFEDHPLFKLIWKLWMRWRGKVWDHAHLHIFNQRSLRDAVTAAGFSIESDRAHHLGMSGVVVGRKTV